MNDPDQVGEGGGVVVRPGKDNVVRGVPEAVVLGPRVGLASAGRIAAPPRTMVVVADGRTGIELIDANAPRRVRGAARQRLQNLLALVQGGRRLRHPPSVKGFERVFRRVGPVIRYLPFRELCENQRNAKQVIRFPGDRFQCPQQPGARTAATKKSAVRGLHEGVDLRLRPPEIFLDQAKELVRGRFDVERQGMLLREESFGCERRKQPADEMIDLPPNIAKSLSEERIAMNGEQDEGFADALAQGG